MIGENAQGPEHDGRRKISLAPPGVRAERGSRARLYVRWMPHLGAEAVALYELLRLLPDVGSSSTDPDELAELLRSTPESVERSLELLKKAGFLSERDGWLEAAPHPPSAGKVGRAEASPAAVRSPEDQGELPQDDFPERKIEVVRAEAEGVSAEDYFRYMGSLPAPHIIEFLNGYSERDGVEPDVIRESLKIASERDARRVGYVRSILERWVERGVKTMEDVELFEQDRKLRLVEQGGATVLRKTAGGEVNGGANRPAAARSEEDYRWFWE